MCRTADPGSVLSLIQDSSAVLMDEFQLLRCFIAWYLIRLFFFPLPLNVNGALLRFSTSIWEFVCILRFFFFVVVVSFVSSFPARARFMMKDSFVLRSFVSYQ